MSFWYPWASRWNRASSASLFMKWRRGVTCNRETIKLIGTYKINTRQQKIQNMPDTNIDINYSVGKINLGKNVLTVPKMFFQDRGQKKHQGKGGK